MRHVCDGYIRFITDPLMFKTLEYKRLDAFERRHGGRTLAYDPVQMEIRPALPIFAEAHPKRIEPLDTPPPKNPEIPGADEKHTATPVPQLSILRRAPTEHKGDADSWFMERTPAKRRTRRGPADWRAHKRTIVTGTYIIQRRQSSALAEVGEGGIIQYDPKLGRCVVQTAHNIYK